MHAIRSQFLFYIKKSITRDVIDFFVYINNDRKGTNVHAMNG